jgi:hypothetical protein
MGSRTKICVHHQRGVRFGTPAFFIAGCPVCEDKKTRGLVKGDEGPPPRVLIGKACLGPQGQGRAVPFDHY